MGNLQSHHIEGSRTNILRTTASGASPSNIGQSLGEIAAGVEAIALNPNARGPLEEFTLFPNLAPEIRIKIWSFAARSDARIFELLWHCYPWDRTGPLHHHDRFYVSRRTNRVPAMMQVNKESREEGMRIFEKRVINTYRKPRQFFLSQYLEPPVPYTWFNPDLDIIYFGEKTCIWTVVKFFYLCGKMKFPKVAFLCTENVRGRCSWKSFGSILPGDNRSMCLKHHAIAGGCSNIQALHGKPEKIALNDLVPGSETTREVFLVVKSPFDEYAGGEMPNTLTFRPAIHDGLDHDDLRRKGQWETEIYCAGLGLDIGCGPNRWANGKMPEFKFVFLAPKIKDGKGKKLRHDGIMVPFQYFDKFTMDNGKFIDSLKLQTGVDIQLRPIFEREVEIGLFNGTDEGINKCKEAIMARLVSRTSIYSINFR
ncbi:hypothetical protein NHQ30_004047 [Ciborinia camelliae]|nr:hypothetical protein NHQ30_004047 [Ciborinia camelliae]